MDMATLETERGQELLEEERRRDGAHPAMFAQPEPKRRSSRERHFVRANLADYPVQEPSGEGMGNGLAGCLMGEGSVDSKVVPALTLLSTEPSGLPQKDTVHFLCTGCTLPAGSTMLWALHVPCPCAACRLHAYFGPSTCPA